MRKQNMNWFATILRVVICFIILSDPTELSVEFCVNEVFEDRGCLDVRRKRRAPTFVHRQRSRRSRSEEKEERQELNLGDAQGTPSKY